MYFKDLYTTIQNITIAIHTVQYNVERDITIQTAI